MKDQGRAKTGGGEVGCGTIIAVAILLLSLFYAGYYWREGVKKEEARKELRKLDWKPTK